MSHIKVQNKPGFVRETTSTAIINNDSDSYQKYKHAKALRESKNQKIDRLEKEVEELRNMLVKFVEGGALNHK
jgi:hypothetical protein